VTIFFFFNLYFIERIVFLISNLQMKKNLKILIVDDHSVVRHGVSLILKAAFQNANFIEAETFPAAIALLKEKPDLILLDINLPGGNSTRMIERIKTDHPDVLIIIFSGYSEGQYALRYIHAGANGFLNKDSSDTEIINAVKTVLKDGMYVSNATKEKILENVLYKTPINPLESLSNREAEVAELLAKGEGNLEIANQLNIQMTTVSTYKTRIFEKLRINNVVSLVEIFKVYEN